MNDLFDTPALEPVAEPVRRDEDQRETWQRELDRISGVVQP